VKSIFFSVSRTNISILGLSENFFKLSFTVYFLSVIMLLNTVVILYKLPNDRNILENFLGIL